MIKWLDIIVTHSYKSFGFQDLKDTTTKMPKKANIFESFSHSAIQQFKEAFGIMDTDKDGLLSSSDLVAAFTAHGKNIGGGEAQVSIYTGYEL